MDYGKRIIAAYVIFILGIVSLVFISMRQKIDLVTDNYYEKEIKYQDEIDKKNRTELLKEKIIIKKDGNELFIEFPNDAIPESGEITFYRPSDHTKDAKFPVKKDIEVQTFNIAEFERGLWKIIIFWNSNQSEYMFEDSFYK